MEGRSRREDSRGRSVRQHRQHVAFGPQADHGGIPDDRILRKPFAAVANALGQDKSVTLRAMCGSFQDLARTAEVRDVVTRTISGHATERVQAPLLDGERPRAAESLTRILTLMPPPVSDRGRRDHPKWAASRRVAKSPSGASPVTGSHHFAFFVGAIGFEPTTPTVSR
jgi:hypothetical protein